MQFPEGYIHLYLTEIGEPRDWDLRIVVSEGISGEKVAVKFGDIVVDSRSIEVNEQSRVFELIWESYVAYAVRNESFAKAELDELPFVGHLTRRFESAFFQFVSTTTFAENDYPGPLQHWALTTLNHCVDVISVDPPQIRQI